MKERLIAMGCPVYRITVSVYGPNPIFYNNRPTYNTKRFTAVGRFVEKKAPYLTITAFKKVVDEFPDAKLIMVGEGELLPLCQRLAKGLKLESNIEFKGVQTSEEIRTLFENSLAFLQHSIVTETGDSEGTPVVILEAQAAALPVISTYHAGIPEVIINNETGLLVEELDVEGMTGHMKRLLTEKGVAERLGKTGRERIKANFTLDSHLKSLEKSIRSAMAKNSIL
jgi:glycosyltransferase involved in cell wall biosynthesis